MHLLIRKTKILFVFVLTVLSTATKANAQTAPLVSEIKSLKSEKWWGLVVDDRNYHTPFGETFEIDTRTLSPMRFTANLLLSSKGRYVWSDEEMSISFNGSVFRITTKERNAEVERGGRTLRDAYLVCCHRHFPPNGITMSETLFRNPIYELGGENSLLYTQQEVVDFADFLLAEGVPKGTILLPIGWQSQSGEIAFDPENYPNPKAMVEYIHSLGMEVMLTVTPYVMASGRGYMQSCRDGRLLNDKNGNPLIFQSRMGYTACTRLDGEQAERLNASLRTLQTYCGIDGYYFDCLDVVPVLESDTRTLVDFFNAWITVSNGIDAAVYSTPVDIQLASAVSAASPSRRTTWDSVAETLRTAVNASVLGFSRTSIAADLDFAQGDDRLVLRTAQLSATLPVAIIPYAAWKIADTAPLKSVLAWRESIADYLVSIADASTRTAEPIIRHLEYKFPNNGFSNCDYQFMIGDSLLVAPAVSASDNLMVRLPRGSWRTLEGRPIRGPKVINVDISDGFIAIYSLEK